MARLSFYFFVACFLSFVLADDGFEWGFTSSSDTLLTECGTYSMYVTSRDSSNDTGTAPYYLFAWPSEGTPTIQAIGSDPTSLSWTVNLAKGTEMILAIVDSNGSDGGQAPDVYTVGGGTTDCLPSSTSTITLWANVSSSKTLDTCQPLGLRVYGGQEPYNLTIAATNSDIVTNVSLGNGNDVYTWPNRADPNEHLIVSVVDANGTWGTSTGIFKTGGSSDTDCSLEASAGNSANVDQDVPQPTNSHAGVIAAAVVVPIVVLALLAFGIWKFMQRRRMLKRRREPAIVPDAWVGPSMAEYRDSDRESYNPYDPPTAGSKQALIRDDYALNVQGNSSQQGRQSQVIYHSDAGGVQEVPPPYIDRAGEGSSSSLAPAELLSQAASVKTEPEPQSTDTKHVYTPPEPWREDTARTSENGSPEPWHRSSRSESTPLIRSAFVESLPESPDASQIMRSLPETPPEARDRKGKGKEVVLE